jgi:hypothetical protein
MDIKIIRLIETRHDHIDYNNNPSIESTIIGIVNVHEDITDLVDLYHENWRRVWDSEDTPEHMRGVCQQKIDTEVIKLSTVQELVSEYKANEHLGWYKDGLLVENK